MLWLRAHREDGRGRYRDPRGDPATLEGHPDRPREVHVSGLRGDQPAAGAVPCNTARMGWAEPSCDDPVREVRTAPAAQSPGRTLRPGRCRAQPLDPGRSGRRLCRRARAHPCLDPRPRPEGRTIARRRHDRAASRKGRDAHSAALDLCPRRPAVCGRRAARGAVLLLEDGKWPTRTGISRDGRASCRPMPMADTTISIAATAILVQ